jgi:hypothetical protein
MGGMVIVSERDSTSDFPSLSLTAASSISFGVGGSSLLAPTLAKGTKKATAQKV